MRTFFLLVCLSTAVSVYAQADPAESSQDGVPGLPIAYRGLSLGMSLDALKTALSKDALFGYRGDDDVSFIPSREESYLETTGTSFIRRALFQIKADMVYIMTFTLNTSLIDHYSVFTTLVKKYGEPLSLDPKQAVWEDDATQISLERPLTIKYIDKTTFTAVADGYDARKTHEILMREDFLSDF
ncbi:MAG: hypothetical protein LBP19_07945 [Treponema sp.]|jgi:hypothetical protein|nr:hypothetical protein [Treponema sp.]